MLSFCQTGPEIIDSCAAAVERVFRKEPHPVFWRLMTTLAAAEPHTSYRTPLALEMMLTELYEDIRKGMGPGPAGPQLAAAHVLVSKKRMATKKAKNEVILSPVVTNTFS